MGFVLHQKGLLEDAAFKGKPQKDGWSVIVCKHIRQHLHKYEPDKLQREITAEKAKVRALAEQLKNKQ